MDSLLDKLYRKQCWEDFLEYRSSLARSKSDLEELRSFIDSESYVPVLDSIKRGDPFPLPRKAVISKMSTGKKRTVYIYPEPENTVLKLLTHLILRKYDGIFCGSLYSFRPGITAKDAVRKLSGTRNIRNMYSYKADISNYFNSVPVDRLIPMIRDVMRDDPPLCEFICGLLLEKHVRDGGTVITEQKGIMAGTPVSSFLANLYLKDMDRHFAGKDILYARYSDDVIFMSPSEEELSECAEDFKMVLGEYGLSLNPDKEDYGTPDTGWTFLGFSYRNGIIDIAPATIKKLKAKMRRKARALVRWRERHEKPPEQAAKAFIRIFNKKLLDTPEDSELSWSLWFFPVINTDRSLHAIDLYAQDCLRYILTGTRTKARYNARYEDLKSLGYRNLVNEYHKYRKIEDKT